MALLDARLSLENMSERPILVTGCAGFLGSHLTDRLLAAGHDVVGIDNFCDFYPAADKRRNLTSALTHGQFELHEMDIRDRAAVLDLFSLVRPVSVVHLAAMAGVRPSIALPAYYTQVNIDGTVNLLDGAVANECQRFLFTSSSSVYGENTKTPFAETDAVDHPISPYAATKRAGELICHTYHHLYGLPVFCLRPFTVYGPRQRPDLAISQFLRRMAADQPITMFGDGTSSRDYTFIDDIIAGYMAALERCGSGDLPGYRIYNLGSDRPHRLADLIRTIAEVTGREPAIRREPMQPGDVTRTWADLTRSRAELGYEPGTPLMDGIRRQYLWGQG